MPTSDRLRNSYAKQLSDMMQETYLDLLAPWMSRALVSMGVRGESALYVPSWRGASGVEVLDEETYRIQPTPMISLSPSWLQSYTALLSLKEMSQRLQGPSPPLRIPSEILSSDNSSYRYRGPQPWRPSGKGTLSCGSKRRLSGGSALNWPLRFDLNS